MPSLIETLAGELERSRELSRRVLNYICDTYGIDESAVGTFLTTELPKLEDDDIDLILSPMFTPKLADQAVFANLLGTEAVSRDEWPKLITALVERPTHAHLVTPDMQPHVVPLREVTIERYLHRLRLEGHISDRVAELLNRIPAPADLATVRAVARRAIWEGQGPQEILVRYLERAPDQANFTAEETLDLLNVVEGRKPKDLDDLLSRISGWKDSLRQQIEAAGGKPFFHDHIRYMHGGDRDQRSQEDERLSAKQHEFAFLSRLEELLR